MFFSMMTFFFQVLPIGSIKFKIIRMVISWIVVNVMYPFAFFEWSTNLVFHNYDMLKNVTIYSPWMILIPYSDIPKFGYNFSTPPRGIILTHKRVISKMLYFTFTITKNVFPIHKAWGTSYRLTTIFAHSGNWH